MRIFPPERDQYVQTEAQQLKRHVSREQLSGLCHADHADRGEHHEGVELAGLPDVLADVVVRDQDDHGGQHREEYKEEEAEPVRNEQPAVQVFGRVPALNQHNHGAHNQPTGRKPRQMESMLSRQQQVRRQHGERDTHQDVFGYQQGKVDVHPVTVGTWRTPSRMISIR